MKVNIPRGKLTQQAQAVINLMERGNRVCRVERDDSPEGIKTFQQLDEIAAIIGWSFVKKDDYLAYFINEDRTPAL